MKIERDLAADLELFIDVLNLRRAWTLAEEVAHDAHARRDGSLPWHKRYIATLADKSQGRVLGSSHGYKLQDHATDKEILEAYGRLTDMAKALGERATELMRHYHARLHAAEAREREGAQPQLNLL